MSSGSSASDPALQNKLVSLVSIIFCRSICREFRRPVEVMHPSLWPDYKAKIKHPMDFGTLLLTCLKGKSNPSSVRDSIRLICANATEFGKDILDFVGTARHLEFFASVLFEEFLSIPFKPLYSTQQEFTAARLANRFHRYQLVRGEPLLITELSDLCDVLQKWPQSRAPPELTVAVATSIQIASDILMLKSEKMNSTKPDSIPDSNVSLFNVLSPILQCCVGAPMPLASMTESINCGAFPALCYLYVDFELPDSGTAGTKTIVGPNSDTLVWLRAIDEALGGLLALVCERCLRGCPFSCTWARPLFCVWVQSSRFPSKMPAMILAGHPQSHVPYLLSETNISRLPFHIAKQLAGTLPKRHNDSDSSLEEKKGALTEATQGQKLSRMIPMGIVLVEICGTHDLYWVRLEAVSPFQATTLDDIEPSRREEACIQEAVQTVQWLIEEGKDSVPVKDVDAFADILPLSADELEVAIAAKHSRKSVEGKAKASTVSAANAAAAAAAAASSSADGTTGFYYDERATNDGVDTTTKKGRAIVNTRSMLAWIDSFKSKNGPSLKCSPPLTFPAPVTSKVHAKGGKRALEEPLEKGAAPVLKLSGRGRKSAAALAAIAAANAAATAAASQANSSSPAKASALDAISHSSSSSSNTNGASLGDNTSSGHNAALGAAGPSPGPSRKRQREPASKSKDKEKDHSTAAEQENMDGHFDNEDDEYNDEIGPKGRKCEIPTYALLFGGCTRYVSGSGIITLRAVDFDEKLFKFEHPSRERRKQLLKQELENLRDSMDELQRLSEKC